MIWTIIGTALGVIGIVLAIIFAKKSSTKKDIKSLGEKIESIPQHIIINSEDYNRISKEIQELEELIQVSLDVNNNLKLSELLKTKQQQLESLKENVNRLHETFNKIPLNTERLQQAKAYFDVGKFREADELLNTEEIASEVERLQAAIERREKEIDKLREDLRDKSNEYLIKAQIWTTLYSEPNWYEKAKKYFEEALKAARTEQALFDFAQFLSKHEQKYAILLYEELLDILRNKSKTNLPFIAAVLHNLGKAHDDINEYPKALEEYEEALKIFRSLENDNPKEYLPFVANTLNCLGGLHSDNKEYSEALNKYEEALEIFKQLSIDNPKKYLSHVPHILNNMGIIHNTILHSAFS